MNHPEILQENLTLWMETKCSIFFRLVKYSSIFINKFDFQDQLKKQKLDNQKLRQYCEVLQRLITEHIGNRSLLQAEIYILEYVLIFFSFHCG